MSQHICQTSDCNCTKQYKPLVNVHMHTHYSALDGVGKIEDYCKIAKEYNVPALAITDHGTAVGIYDFYKKVKDAGLKPILGEEFYLALDLNLRKPNREREVVYKDKHQTILIKDSDGYKNFCKLNYLSYTEGYYYKPRVSYDMLFQHAKGLIITSGCAASMFNQLLMNGKEKEAEEWFKKFVDTFGDNFYGEIQFNELNDKDKFGMSQAMINNFIIKMCNKYDIPTVIGGDTHYATPEEAKLQDILIACQRRKDGPADEANLESFIHARHLYFHNSDNYLWLNKEFGFNYDEKFIEQCLENSVKLSEKVNYEFDTNANNYPKFPLPNNTTSIQLLETLAFNGLHAKLNERQQNGESFTDEQIDGYAKRLEYELSVIQQKGYEDYFLVFQDWVKWAKGEGYWLGPGRGSAAGALLSYGLGITDIDPIRFNLLFERFLNPERSAKPDIDQDTPQGAREKIREYLENKYGKDAVFGVATYHLYHPKSALQDCSRGLGKDTSFTSTLMLEVSKLPDLEEQKNLPKYFEGIYNSAAGTPTLRKWIDENQDTIYWAQKMLGSIKNLGTHAGGIVVTPGPIYNYIPVARGGGEIVTAFRESDGSAKDLSELGILKLDILGLKTLNVIQGCVRDIKRDLGIDITNKVKYIDLDDPALYDLVRAGKLLGIFQLDGGAAPLVNAVQPKRFQDIIAISSLNRPGPLETFAPVYAKWKRYFEEGKEHLCEKDNPNIFPRLDFMQKITKKNYYCMIHQEDFMLMVAEAADFNLGEADNFRRAIAWREDHPKYYTVKKYFDKLEQGMLVKGYSKDDVDYFVDYCRKFSGYSFNESHSTSYAYIAMQCAYLKANYPAYFYANFINTETHEEYSNIIADALANGIEILPPSITKSKNEFAVEDGKIRIGLKALKGLGETAIKELEDLEVNKCESIYEILTLPMKKVNSKGFQCLIDAGAFDELGVERDKIETLKELYKEAKRTIKIDEETGEEKVTEGKISKWFFRKRKALEVETMPEALIIFPENIILSTAQRVKESEQPGQDLVTELIPYLKSKPIKEEDKDKRFEAVVGFSMMTINKIKELKTLVDANQDIQFTQFSQWHNESELFMWVVLDKSKATTKTGRKYENLHLTDGNTTISVKIFTNVHFEKRGIYVSRMKKDKYGFSIVMDEFLTKVG